MIYPMPLLVVPVFERKWDQDLDEVVFNFCGNFCGRPQPACGLAGMASNQANTVEYNCLFNRSLMRRLSNPR